MKTIGKIALVALGAFLILGLVVPAGIRIATTVWDWGLQNEVTVPECPACACNTDTVNSPAVDDDDFDCKAEAEALGAPPEMVRALCVPAGTGSVSDRLPVGTEVSIGTITFDAEDRVWVLQDFVTPSIANYSFEYAGAETKLFEAPFVLGSELGWGDNGTRVPFKICWDTTSEGCIPPSDLFPSK